MVESLVDIMLGSSHPSVASTNRLSPISVLENSSSSINSNGSNSKSGSSSGSIMSFSSSLKFPVRARSKPRRKRRRDMLGQQWQWWGQENSKANTKQGAVVTKVSSTMGRKCQHCQAEKTPQWRAGPMGPKTLCNACGVRYKSGRLVPEYRPASSPTFSSLLHSNSHRKVMEMRRKKQLPEMVLKPAEIG
ncbi:Erythroid transcription factor [Ancistrocladus abbreviatus]